MKNTQSVSKRIIGLVLSALFAGFAAIKGDLPPQLVAEIATAIPVVTLVLHAIGVTWNSNS
jgi:hypothetical protein